MRERGIQACTTPESAKPRISAQPTSHAMRNAFQRPSPIQLRRSMLASLDRSPEPAAVRPGLQAVAAEGHRAPVGRTVLRLVEEGPAAVAARLQAPPAAVEHRGGRDADEPSAEPVDAADLGLETRCTGLEDDGQPGRAGGLR